LRVRVIGIALLSRVDLSGEGADEARPGDKGPLLLR